MCTLAYTNQFLSSRGLAHWIYIRSQYWGPELAVVCVCVFCISSYSYCIDGSLDEKDWIRLVDHTRYLCRSWQNLRFPARVVR